MTELYMKWQIQGEDKCTEMLESFKNETNATTVEFMKLYD